VIKYHHLSYIERQKIELLLSQNLSKRCIARQLGRNHSTIIREIGRIKSYSWDKADRLASDARRNKRRKIESDGALKAYIINNLHRKWSPEQISGRLIGAWNHLCVHANHLCIYKE
jgi:IS30 family transposase